MKRIHMALLAGCAVCLYSSTTALGQPELAIWDGHGELLMLVRVTDAATHEPIRDAVVTLIRAHDAEIVPDDSPLATPPPARTDSRGYARLKATFDAEGDSRVTNLLVGNSCLLVTAGGYSGGRSWVSTPSGRLNIRIVKAKAIVPPIGKLQFQANTRSYKAAYDVVVRHM